jgi:hypothetical protein
MNLAVAGSGHSLTGKSVVITFGGVPTPPIATDIGKVVTNVGGTHTGILRSYGNSTEKTWEVEKRLGEFTTADSLSIVGGTGAGVTVASVSSSTRMKFVSADTVYDDLVTMLEDFIHFGISGIRGFGGGGGGGGAGTIGTAGAGGGGGGGGAVLIECDTLVLPATASFVIDVSGGDGGDGVFQKTGGGGGGGGGTIIIFARHITKPGTDLVEDYFNISGGIGGLDNGAAATFARGGGGSCGILISLNINDFTHLV